MNTWIALLRGVNVGGHNKLPMQALRQSLQTAGFADVATYIQSGNIVLASEQADGAAVSKQIATGIADEFGFQPQVFVLSAGRFTAIAEANPFPSAANEPKNLHCFFLDAQPAQANLDKLQALKSASESLERRDAVLYLHAPDGIGRSKLAAAVDRTLKVGVTARNWRTVQALLELCKDRG